MQKHCPVILNGLELELGVCDKTRQSGSLLKDLNTCLRVIYERGVDEPYLMSNIFQKGKCKGCCQEEICNEYRMFIYTWRKQKLDMMYRAMAFPAR